MEILIVLIPIIAGLVMNKFDSWVADSRNKLCPPHTWSKNILNENLECLECGYRNTFNNFIHE